MNRIPKKMGEKPLKNVKTSANTVAEKRKRERIAQHIVGMYESWMGAREIFLPDEAWVGQDSRSRSARSRLNPQNGRRDRGALQAQKTEGAVHYGAHYRIGRRRGGG